MSEPNKILIAEDDQFFLKILSKQLQNGNYEVRFAGNGREALEISKEFHPDLVISDWMMPEMTGEQFCRELKQSPNLKWAYFIMLTAKDRIEDLVISLEGGADEFLIKPCDSKELMARVKTGLRIVSLQRENARLQRIDAINQTAITTNHEINNPLQGIIMNAELVLQHNPKLDNTTKSMLNNIIDNVRRIRRVTKKLETMIESVSKEYTDGGPSMIDIDRSIAK